MLTYYYQRLKLIFIETRLLQILTFLYLWWVDSPHHATGQGLKLSLGSGFGEWYRCGRSSRTCGWMERVLWSCGWGCVGRGRLLEVRVWDHWWWDQQDAVREIQKFGFVFELGINAFPVNTQRTWKWLRMWRQTVSQGMWIIVGEEWKEATVYEAGFQSWSGLSCMRRETLVVCHPKHRHTCLVLLARLLLNILACS